jgi:hypothetical protein
MRAWLRALIGTSEISREAPSAFVSSRPDLCLDYKLATLPFERRGSQACLI